MLELKPSEFHRVAAFFESLPYGPSIPNSVISGIGHGRVFANDTARPTAALVYNNGACTVAGAVDDLVFAEQVCQWLLQYHGSDYFILYAFPEAWEPALDGFLGSASTSISIAQRSFSMRAMGTVFQPGMRFAASMSR